MGRDDKGKEAGTNHFCKVYKAKKSYEAKDKEKAYIIGGGTSVNEIFKDPFMYDDLHQYILFGCNKSVEYFDCDYMVYHDLKFAHEFSNLLDSFDGGGGIHAPLPSKGNRDQKRDDVNYFDHSQDISFDLKDGLNTGNNCGVAALSLAVALGFKDIYLLGMDGRFNLEKTESHFHGGYGHDLSDRAYDSFRYFFEVTGKALKKARPDVKVYNCSYISLIDNKEEYFERIGIRESFDTRTGKNEIQQNVCGSP